MCMWSSFCVSQRLWHRISIYYIGWTNGANPCGFNGGPLMGRTFLTWPFFQVTFLFFPTLKGLLNTRNNLITMIHMIFLVVTDYAFSTLTVEGETYNSVPFFMLDWRKILKKILTGSIDLDTSWKSFSLGMVEDVGTECCHLFQKFRL